MKKIILILFFQFLFSQSLVDFDLSKSFISYDGKHPAHNWTGISKDIQGTFELNEDCLLYTSPSPRDLSTSRMPSSA